MRGKKKIPEPAKAIPRRERRLILARDEAADHPLTSSKGAPNNPRPPDCSWPMPR